MSRYISIYFKRLLRFLGLYKNKNKNVPNRKYSKTLCMLIFDRKMYIIHVKYNP